jgi:hypothetical protein
MPFPILAETTGLPYMDFCRIIDAAGSYGLPNVENWFFHHINRRRWITLRIEFAESLTSINQIKQFVDDLVNTGLMAIYDGEYREFEVLDVEVEDEYVLYHIHPIKGLVKLCPTDNVYNGGRLPYVVLKPRPKDEPEVAEEAEREEPHQNY